jgi:serine/threonine protein kinase
MEYKDRWHIIGYLGEGGQGEVYRVLDNNKFNIDGTNGLFETLAEFIRDFRQDTNVRTDPKIRRKARIVPFQNAVAEIIRMEDPANHGALKVLRGPKEARDADLAEERIKKEIEGMSKVSHPNLLKILDRDPDSKWFVSQFHPKGTLVKNKDRFTGNFVGSLRAFRPLVEAVSVLHRNGLVHRDIKPQNVFLDTSVNLVLGDFGLVFFSDEQHKRVSATFENVGSRDWMPAWAMGMRIEEIRPTFDVFCLGKLLWAMVSRIPILRLWYFDRRQFNLEEMFPGAPSIKLANPLLRKCIVEDEEDCLADARTLLEEVDRLLTIIDRNADLIGENVVQPCKVCGIGDYRLIVNRKDVTRLRNFGINAVSGQSFKIFTCSHCGHVRLFSFRDKETPSAWAD